MFWAKYHFTHSKPKGSLIFVDKSSCPFGGKCSFTANKWAKFSLAWFVIVAVYANMSCVFTICPLVSIYQASSLFCPFFFSFSCESVAQKKKKKKIPQLQQLKPSCSLCKCLARAQSCTVFMPSKQISFPGCSGLESAGSRVTVRTVNRNWVQEYRCHLWVSARFAYTVAFDYV